MPLHKIMISGGGTGGHIYPALAIAEEIHRRFPECEIRFVGAIGRMEMEKIPAAGYPIDGLWITGIERKLLSKKNLLFPFRLISSLWKARKLIKAFQPDAAVGVGGFASGPLLQIASTRRIPCLIQEQNSYPGITNKLLAKRVSRICTGFPDMERWFPEERTVYTGNPLRATIGAIKNKKKEGLLNFGFSTDQPVVFIMGGSLGARSVNAAVKNALQRWSEAGIQVLWQTGRRFYEDNRDWVERSSYSNVKVVGFIDRMDLAYAAANVIVSRAGAMSVAELALVGKAVVFVPSPHVAEDHQTHNARSLTDHNAAILLPDSSVREELGGVISDLLENESLRQELGTRIREFARPNAAKAVVDELEKIATS